MNKNNNERPSLKTNQAALHSIGVVALFFAQWLISTLLVRLGGFYDAGVFSLAMTVSNVFAYFANFGVRTFMLTNNREEFQQRQYKSAACIAIAGSFVLCIGYILIAGQYSGVEMIAIILYLVYNNFNSYSEIMFGRLQLSGRLDINGISNLIRGAICFSVFIGSYLIFHQMIVSLICMAVAAGIVCIFHDGIRYRKIIGDGGFAFKPDFRNGFKILICCVPIMLTNVIPLVTTAIPRTTIQKVWGTELLGYFSTIFTPTVLISVVVPSVMQSLLPSFSDNWKNNPSALKKQILKGYLFILFLMGVAMILALLVGRQIMALLFGEEILTYFSLLYWAIFVTSLNAAVTVGNNILIAMHKNRDLLISNILAMALCAALSSVFVTHWSLKGATYALLVAYTMQAVYQITMIMMSFHKGVKDE